MYPFTRQSLIPACSDITLKKAILQNDFFCEQTCLCTEQRPQLSKTSSKINQEMKPLVFVALELNTEFLRMD